MKFKTLFFTITLLFACSAMAQAQDDYNGWEFYGGYSYLHSDSGIEEALDDDDVNFHSHGFNASITGNFHRYVGGKFDYSFHSKSRNFNDAGDDVSASLRTNQFLGGLQFKDNAKEGGRFRPFAHVLAGVANQNLSASGTLAGTPPTTFDDSVSSNNFAMVFGGGIDVKVSNRVDLRLIQLDYNPIWFRDQVFEDLDLPGRTQNNFRIGVGIVIH